MRMSSESRQKRDCTLGGDARRIAAMHVALCHQAVAAVTVVMVAVLGERRDDAAGVVHAGEAHGKVGAYLVVLNRLSLNGLSLQRYT